MIQRIDDWYFDRVFQPIADWFVLTFGWNCFQLSRAARLLFAISQFCDACWVSESMFNRVVSFFIAAVNLASCFFESDPAVTNGARNSLRLRDSTIRPIFFTLQPASVFGWMGHVRHASSYHHTLTMCMVVDLGWLAMVCAWYWWACDPHPPVRYDVALQLVET